MSIGTSRAIVAIIILVAILGGIFYYIKRDTSYMAITTFEECRNAGYPVEESMPEQCRTPDGRMFVNTASTQATSTPSTSTSTTGSTSTTSGNATSNEIRNVNVKADQVITSPLTITGEAKGWYFEASFPIQIVDGSGKVIAQGPAQAQGDWMTSNFVPFKATLSFAKPSTATGTLILRNDNPSGLPENQRELRIPVRFSTVSTSVNVQVQ